MSVKTPVQIVLVRNHSDKSSLRKTEPYLDALRIAFEGHSSDSAVDDNHYLTDPSDLKIHVLDPPRLADVNFDIRPLLNCAEHLIVVCVLDNNEQELPETTERLLEAAGDEKSVVVSLPESITDGDIQTDEFEEGELEPRLLPVSVALTALEVARRAIYKSLSTDSTDSLPLKYFLSHAKVDGVPIALSLIELLNRMRSRVPKQVGLFEKFYDVYDLKRGSDWRYELERHAKNCVLIALRTEEYESRYWCRKEYQWAEENQVPIVVVDLRHRLYHSPGPLSFETAPSVRLHDGNMLRVLFHATLTHLKFLCTQYAVSHQADVRTIVLPRKPTTLCIEGVYQCLLTSTTDSRGVSIIYPSPNIPVSERTQFERILNITGGKVNVVSTAQWRATS